MSQLHTAYELLQQGQSQNAADILHALLENEPDNSQASYLLGLIAMEFNDEQRAIDWFKQTVRISPKATPAQYNLGVLHQNRGELDTAKNYYQTAADLDPQDPDTRFNLALVCKQLGQLTEAKDHFETILKHQPSDIDSLYNLANTEQGLQQNMRAIALLETLLKQAPNHLSALNNLGYLYHKEGNREKAIPVYQTLIKNNHNTAAATHLLASLTGSTTSHAPTAYVRDVFDQFADHFDENLQGKLGYNTPTILRELLQAIAPDASFQHGLDLGCGTGLSGETFNDCTDHLTGIDLSPKMLKQATKKGIYTDLFESDLVPFIQQAAKRYDLYLAADVFVYIGDLAPLFSAIAKQKNSATFIFSTEQATKAYTLKATGRYGHSVAYIKALAQEHGFEITAHQSAPIRKEGAEWINCELYILKKDQPLP
jgi:predicted TPR repeat methyltransferase